ncbi:hypothetical protein ACFQX6_08310 [Streptosporangium lutulentum]
MREADEPGFDRRLLPPMLLGSVLNPINSTIISVALVPIGDALGTPSSQTAWLVSALYLATSLGQPVVGRSSTSSGRADSSSSAPASSASPASPGPWHPTWAC